MDGFSDGTDEKIAIPDLLKFVSDCFHAVGISRVNSDEMASTLVSADMNGYRSQGLFQLDSWICDLNNGNIDLKSHPRIEKETPATAMVDGRNGLAPLTAKFCMQLAIQKAKQVGAAIVVANNSNYLGAAGRYSQMAIDEGMIGWTCSNTSPVMVPTRAKYASTGSNPIAFGAPGLSNDRFLLDMSTTVYSDDKIAMKAEDKEYLPVGVAWNAACMPETITEVAAQVKRYLPLGSEENMGSYKGTGLSMMVDILCGVLPAALYGNNVGAFKKKPMKKKPHIGHCFIAIDPRRFATGFEGRLSQFMDGIRSMEPWDPSKPVRVAGDKSAACRESTKAEGCIWYPAHVINHIKNVARNVGIKCVAFMPKTATIALSPSEELVARLEAEIQREEVPIVEEDEVTKETIASSQAEEEPDALSIVDDSWEWLTEFEDKKDRKKQTDRYEPKSLEVSRTPSLVLSLQGSIKY